MKERIENITKLIPVIYPIAIFLGYYNHYIYYKFFDIEIFNYLNIYELLFSFISMVIPLFVTLFLSFCYLVFVAIIDDSPDKEKNKPDENFDDSHLTPIQKRLRKINSNKETKISFIFNKSHQNSSRSWILFKHKIKKKKYGRAFSHFMSLLFSLFSFSFKVILWSFFIYFSFTAFHLVSSPFENELGDFKPLFTSIKPTIFCLTIWSSIVYAIIYRYVKKNKNIKVRLLNTIPLIFIIIFLLTYFQKLHVEKTINHETTDVSFNYESKRIESNSKLVFIGKTSDFIFLRDLDKETNLIFPIKDITHLNTINLKKVEIRIKEEQTTKNK